MTLFPRLKNYWYIAASSTELKDQLLPRTIFGERMVLFRNRRGQPFALLDRCAHRNMALSLGKIRDGSVECPYHGWRYDGSGICRFIPALCDKGNDPKDFSVRSFPVAESGGYIWVYPGEDRPHHEPHPFPHWGESGWTSFRMKTRFQASVFSCLENFLDCPHTVFVHQGWFRRRNPKPLSAEVKRFYDRIEVNFIDEPEARSLVSHLLFPKNEPLRHTDRFLMPSTSRVDYTFGPSRRFIITSQCTPVSERETEVYTVVTFRFGQVGSLVRLFFEPLCRWIIRQDVEILKAQTKQLDVFGGPDFTFVETDLFGRHILHLWEQREKANGSSAEFFPPDQPQVKEEISIRF